MPIKRFGKAFRTILREYEKKVEKKLTNFTNFHFWHFFTLKNSILSDSCLPHLPWPTNGQKYLKNVLVQLLGYIQRIMKKKLEKSWPTSKFLIFGIFSHKNRNFCSFCENGRVTFWVCSPIKWWEIDKEAPKWKKQILWIN